MRRSDLVANAAECERALHAATGAERWGVLHLLRAPGLGLACERAEHDPAPRDAGEHRRPPTFARRDHACEAHPYTDMPQWRLMENLRRAEEHVVVGAKNVARQRDISGAGTERSGHDAGLGVARAFRAAAGHAHSGSRPSFGRAARADIVRIGVVGCSLSYAPLCPPMPHSDASCPRRYEPMKLVHTIPPLGPAFLAYCPSCCHAETKQDGRAAADRSWARSA